MRNRRRTMALAVLLAAGCVGAWYARKSRAPEVEPAPGLAADADTARRLALLETSLHAIAAGERDAPQDRWDPEDVVAMVGRDPDTLLAWVRDNTQWIPYRGVLRGPIGVLMDREGNSLDRSLLLVALLEKAGHRVRLAHGELARGPAEDLLPDLVARRAVAMAAPSTDPPQPDVSAAGERFDLDGATLAGVQQVQRDHVRRLFTELQSRVLDQVPRLLATLPSSSRSDLAIRHEQAVTALRDHWWVQWQDDSAWKDLDPLGTPATTWEPGAIGAGMYHELAVRVVAEHLTPGGLEETRVIEHVIRPSETVGRTVILQIWPGDWPQELHSDPDSPHGLRAAALAQDEWAVALAVGSDVVAEGTIQANEDEAPASGSPMGGLGRSMAGMGAAGGSREPASELTAAWIEYEVRAPGEAPRIIRRAVFDLFGPAARAAGTPGAVSLDERMRLTRNLALILRAEILPVGFRIAPEYLAHLAGQSLLANRSVLRAVIRGEPAVAALDRDSLFPGAAPAVTPLMMLALARLEWSRHQAVQFVDRIGLLVQHRHPGLVGDSLTMRGAVEVVARDLGISLEEQNGFGVRHEQGVLDTNAEALWWVGEGINNTGEAFAARGDWVTLSPGSPDAADQLSLPADARVRIRQALASGLAVVAPASPVSRGPDHYVGWWTIDPNTGATAGVPGAGWGQCGSEYSVTLRAAVTNAVWRAGWEFVLCHGIAQAANAFRYAGAELQARGIWFWWVGPIRATSIRETAMASNVGCLIGAIKSGLVSTLPFLIARYNLQTAPWILPPPNLLDRVLSDQRGAGRFPPGWVRGPIRPGGGPPEGNGPPTQRSIQVPQGAGTTPKGYPNPAPAAPAPPPVRPMPRPPGAPPMTPELQKAWEDYTRAQKAAADALGSMARYNFKNGANPKDPAFVGLERVVGQRMDAMNAAGDRLKAANLGANRAAGRGGFPPPVRKPAPVPAPAAPGNENPTVPEIPVPPEGSGSGGIEAGSAGVSSSLDPGPP